MKKWVLNLAVVLLTGLMTLGMICFIPREIAASTQFEQGAGYQAGAYDRNAAQPATYNWTRQSQFVGPASPHQKWVFSINSSSSCSSPAIGSDGTIYVGFSDKNLYALGPDGTLKWSFPTEYWNITDPTIGADGTIFVCSGNILYAINHDGTKMWSFLSDANYAIISPVIGADGTIYAGSVDHQPMGSNAPPGGKLYAINPDGSTKWFFQTESDFAISPAIGADGTIYFGSDDGKFYAVNPDGTQKWSFPILDTISSFQEIGSDGTIYFGSDDYKFYALNPDGTQKWSFLASDRTGSPAVGSDGIIYFGSFNKLYAIDSEGTQKWYFPATGPISSSPVIGADGIIYFGSYDHKFYAINPDGTQKWFFDTGGAVDSSPAIGEDGTIYFGSSDGKLYAIADEPKPDEAIKILINSVPQNFPQPPVMINNRVMVPLRGIFEALGASVKWDGQTQTVRATKGSTTVKLKIGDSTAYKNGQPVNLDPPAQIVNGSTMVPVRFVSEALGAEVKWDGVTQTVKIDK